MLVLVDNLTIPFNIYHLQDQIGHLFTPGPLPVYPIETSILYLRVLELEVACSIYENFPVMKHYGSRLLPEGSRSQSRRHHDDTE